MRGWFYSKVIDLEDHQEGISIDDITVLKNDKHLTDFLQNASQQKVPVIFMARAEEEVTPYLVKNPAIKVFNFNEPT